ncbi:MAG: hypothetical protein PVG98_06215, partial [Chromatiales bacterium]
MRSHASCCVDMARPRALSRRLLRQVLCLLAPTLVAGGAWASGGAWTEALRTRDTAALERLAADRAAPVDAGLAD